ncbi:MAG: YbaB/EbfC family nucleoid-associated protein [Spirochaetales bacterium]|nr:YbaB/EbfC family nucleoid-associated protein [Spirochaetales bacterium]
MNPFDMIKNLKELQTNMKEVHEKMQSIHVIGSAGGGMVKITLNGQMEITDIYLAPEVVDPSEIIMLQDLIRSAHANAMANIKDKVREEMASVSGPLPPGFTGF